MTTIKRIHARYVYDSRGNPTVEVDLTTNLGTFRSIVPSGASTGSNEAVELRDGDKSKWEGKGVLQAVENVNEILGPELIKSEISVTKQKQVDDFLKKLDGTANKSKLGANAILGVSMAVCKAGAAELKLPSYEHIAQLAGDEAAIKNKKYVLPVPFLNVLNGGVHAGGKLAFQEFMIAPIGASSFREGLRYATEVYHTLKKLAQSKYGQGAGNVGDEGGVAPNVDTPKEALDLIYEAIKKSGYEGKVCIGMDAASSEFHKVAKQYDLDFKSPKHNKILSGEQLGELYVELLQKYPIVLLEDPFAEDDWDSWKHFYNVTYKKLDQNVEIVTDDLTVTNTKILQNAIQERVGNSLLLKVNQIGTVSESIDAANMAFKNDWSVFVSHRSGETEDTFIADLTVGLKAGHLKSGAPARSERLAKYNQLLRIEEQIGDDGVYAGRDFGKAKKL